MKLYPTLFLIAVGALKFTTSELINGTPELANGDRPTRKLKKNGNSKSKKESTIELEKELKEYKKDLELCVAMSEFSQDDVVCVENVGDSLSLSEIQEAEDLFYAEMTLDGCTIEEIFENPERCVTSFLSIYSPQITKVIQNAIKGKIEIEDPVIHEGAGINILVCNPLRVDASVRLDTVTGLNNIVINGFTSIGIPDSSSKPPLTILNATIGAVAALPNAGAEGGATASLSCKTIFGTSRTEVGGSVGTKVSHAIGSVTMGGGFIVSTDTNELCLEVATQELEIERCRLYDVKLGFRLCILRVCVPLGWLISRILGPILSLLSPLFCSNIGKALKGEFKKSIDKAVNKAGSCSIPECEGCLGICLKTGKLGRCE